MRTESDEDRFESPPSVVDAVAAELRRRILKGRYQLGERLPETQLTEHLGVSRPPLREALRIVEKAGLVVSAPRKGWSVVSLTVKDVREIYSLRDSLERLALELGVPTDGPSRVVPLRDSLLRMSAAAKSGRLEELTVLNLQFHRGIAALPGHKRLLESYDMLAAQLQLCMSRNLALRNALSGDPGESIARHQTLFDLILAGDRDAVLHALANHGHRSLLESLHPDDELEVVRADAYGFEGPLQRASQ